MANPAHDRGHAGEQSMGFYWGERGYFLVDGPSGAGGHAANAAGFDGIAFNPDTGHMVIYDNKAFARMGNVYDATAISKNLAKNLDTLHARVTARPDIPQQQTILSNISAARAAVTQGSGASWPNKVQLAVSNASGQSTGVGGKLANGTISFIDYYAAPTPMPAPSPKSAPGGGGAGYGKVWNGPGGTPGFNTTRIQGIGNALGLFQQWAQQLSIYRTAADAWNELLEREDEIINEQNRNPLYPVYIKIYWKVLFEKTAMTFQIYQYLGADIRNGCDGKPPESLWDASQHSYLMVIPALTRGPKTVSLAAPANWRDGYTTIVGVLSGDHTHGGDPEEALRILNGSPMYDILPIIRSLKTHQPFLFNKMEQFLSRSTGLNVYVGRLEAAILAVRLSENSAPNSFSDYKAVCKEFAHLPDDQQKNIEEFMSGKRNAAQKALLSPEGEWRVQVSKWIWTYNFDATDGVTWRDPFNGMEGKGKWKLSDDKMTITWLGSPTVDVWYLPFDPQKQRGNVRMKEGTYLLSATKA